VTSSYDQTIKVWDNETFELIRTLTGHPGKINAVAVSPEGRYIVSGGGWLDNSVRIWDAMTGRLLNVLTRHSYEIISVAVSFDGKMIISKSSDSFISIWDITSGKLIKSYSELSDGVTNASFSPDSRCFISAGQEDNRVVMWDIMTGKEVRSTPRLNSSVSCLAVSSDERYIISGSLDKSITIWDYNTFTEYKKLTEHTGAITSLCFSYDGRIILSGSNDRTIKMWFASTGHLMLNFEGHNGAVFAVAVSPDEKQIVTSGSDKKLIVWNAVTSKQIQEIKGSTDKVYSVAFAPDGKSFASTGGSNETIRIWDAVSGQFMRTIRGGHTEWITSIAYSPDGRKIASGSSDKTAAIWDIFNTSKPLKSFIGHSAKVNSIAFTQDGSRLITGSVDKTIKIWDVSSGTELKSIPAHESAVTSVAVSPDGKFIASGGEDKYMNLWNIETGAKVFSVQGHTLGINSVAYSPDGKYIATASSDKTVMIWDALSGDKVKVLIGHKDIVRQVIFSRDGKIASCGNDNSIIIWDIGSGSQLARLNGHTYAVSSIDFSPNGKYLVSGGWDCTVKIWDLAKESNLADLISLGNYDWAVVNPQGIFDVSEDGSRMVHFSAGMEVISLSQLKDRYYEPGLLSKIMGFNKEKIRSAPALESVELYPNIELLEPQSAEDSLKVIIENQGGGIGKTEIFINNKLALETGKNPADFLNRDTAVLSIDLANHEFIQQGKPNKITVHSYNAKGTLLSRDREFFYQPSGMKVIERFTNLWAIIIGISDYFGSELDLKYAAKDAVDIAEAIKVTAYSLFGDAHVHINILTADSSTSPGIENPTKNNIVNAFESLQKISPEDILFIYLAGHGKNIGGEDGDFYYLTDDAAKDMDYEDPSVRARVTISSSELMDLILKIPAQKQILIADACSSGEIVDKFLGTTAVPSSQIRAYDKLKEKTGLFLIAGSATDAVSYESPRFGQGVLTYTLLMGMRGGSALRQDKYIDVKKLLDFAAERVPELAYGIGGIQKPVVGSKYGSAPFDIGEVTRENRDKIPLADAYPVFVPSAFLDDVYMRDHLEISKKVDDKLFEMSSSLGSKDYSGPGIIFLKTYDYPNAYSIAGRYKIVGGKITVKAVISRSLEDRMDFSVSGAKEKLEELTIGIIDEAVKKMKEMEKAKKKKH
ncbi:MAG: hypothetical protein QG635_1019, partial [Bacteroidota bacterium]|nr:hypothetical protein [Bacteroidota bacterium]